MPLNPSQNLINLGILATGVIAFVAITRKDDPLEDNIVVLTLNRTDFEGWDFAHFGIHFAITAMDYNNYPYSGLLSVGWEEVEKILAKDNPYWLDDSEHDYKVNALGMLSGMAYNKFFVRKI